MYRAHALAVSLNRQDPVRHELVLSASGTAAMTGIRPAWLPAAAVILVIAAICGRTTRK
jgi:hypothetical protein